MLESLEVVPNTNHSVRIGKDVLELLSSSMYLNPLTIFREYVQNSTDSIDDAIESGTLGSTGDGKIEIQFDRADRSILIRDNGAGISNEQFSDKMLSIGDSEKRGLKARGFRGVGRLSGLGYSQELVFRSRCSSNESVLEAKWDCRLIKQLMGDRSLELSLEEIVQEVVTIRRVKSSDYPEHFFEVEIRKPKRIGKDILMNEVEIDFYLSQNCPCPFHPNFIFSKQIEELTKPFENANRAYNIFVNGNPDPVYRPFRERIEYSETKGGSFKEFRAFNIPGQDGGIAAVGWVLHHDYQGAIPIGQGVRGLRARVGNIQIGNDKVFSQVFSEDRFCSWTVGEVHILDRRVIPNGRRDDFELSNHYSNILSHLRPLALEVSRECRSNSQLRVRLKDFDLGVNKITEKIQIIEQGAVSENTVNELSGQISDILSNMEKVSQFGLFDSHTQSRLSQKLDAIKISVDVVGQKQANEPFGNLSKHNQDAFQEIFDLIYECSVNKIAAKSLIDRMLLRIANR